MSQIEPVGVETPTPAPPPRQLDIPLAGSWVAMSLPWVVLIGHGSTWATRPSRYTPVSC